MSQSQQIRKACASSTILSKTSKLLSFPSYRCISRYARVQFYTSSQGKIKADMECLDQAYLGRVGRSVPIGCSEYLVGR